MLMFTEKRLFRVMFVFTPPGLDLISQQYHPVICLLSSVSVCFLFPHLPSPGWLSRPTSSFLLAEDGGWWRMVEAAP